jgi:glycosyltransferase involved in cell wall biosynthesis
MKPSVSFLIAAYNEEATLEAAFTRGLGVLAECTGDYEVVILDDASRDGTWPLMEKLQKAHPARLRLLRHEMNRGIAATFEELYRAATKDYVFLTSADNQFPTESLRQIVPLLATYDIVICRRTHKPYTRWRTMISKLYRWLPRLLFGVELYDAGSIKCIRREIITTVPVTSKGVFVEAERLIRAARRGYKIGVVDIRQEPRRGGVASGARLPVVFQAARDLIALWVRFAVLRQKP